ncbi:hypothetical protein BH20PSE1_BH20PSE1_02780 [soil metagenome]
MSSEIREDVQLPWTGERYVPEREGEIEMEHLHRYAMARDLAYGKDVLDIACGEGYGSELLGTVARRVTGVDISEEAIAHASRKYSRPNIAFAVGSCAGIPLPDASIDLVVSFETIEHHDQHLEMMHEVRRVLRSDGVLIISSPDKHEYSDAPGYKNEYHVKELYLSEFKDLLATAFKHVRIFGQRVYFGSFVAPTDGRATRFASYSRRDESVRREPGVMKPVYYIAVASNGALPQIPGGLYEGGSYLSSQIAGRDGQVASLNQAVVERDRQIDRLNQAVAERNRQIDRLNQAVAERNGQIDRLNQAVAERNGRIDRLNQAVAERNGRIARLNRSVTKRDGRIATLNQAVAQRDAMLRAMRASTSWRATAALRFVKAAASRLYPRRRMNKGPSVTAKSLYPALSPSYDIQDAASGQPAALTRTESVARLPGNAFTTTEAEVRSSTPQVSPASTCWGDNGEAWTLMNHALWLYLLREFGFADAARTMSLLSDFSLLTPSSDSAPPPAAAEFSRWVLALTRLLNKSVSEQPEATVILPVHNQLRHTLACLTSLLTWPTDRTFEVIVADDASTDTTAKLLGALPAPVRLIRQDQNLGFLRHCNRVATEARGNVLVFLNNDTFVLPGWLDELIRTFDDHDKAGLVGSKLLFADGRLQEAGGLIWSDGSGWNFGRGQDPDEPHMNFCREMDYCSAASIAVRTELWRQLGGFDERYAPAYYEDSDLAFRIREAGLQVLYQPRSQLIHFEGISHGVETTSGVKQHQVTNQQEFLRRWSSVIADRRVPEQPVGYYCRYHLGAHALFVDACTPAPDHDSGSIDALNLMLMLKQFGLHVTFCPNSNSAHFGRYTRDLQRRGIECLYRPFVSRLEPWLEEHGRELTVVVLSRVSQASPVLPLVRNLAPQATIVFNTVDIHFLRLAREAELGSDRTKLEDSERTRRAELEVMVNVDLTLVVSKHEKEMLRSLVPEANIGWLPLPREIPGRSENPSTKRRDIVFLGGFDHLPNRDAVEYFLKEIWPLILAEDPNAHFVIAGSKMPKDYGNLTQEGVEVRGLVEDLDAFFAEARMSVAPLRYGAGQKGKIVTSFSYGVPVVCTPVAAEGMEIFDGEHALIAGTPRDFAQAVLRLLLDDSLWERLSLNGLALAERLHSYERVAERFHTMLRNIGVPVANPRDVGDSRAAPSPLPIAVFADFSIHIVACGSQHDFSAHLTAAKDDLTSRLAQEQKLAESRPFSVPGYCRVCDSPSRFEIDYINGSARANDLTVPNWRETLTCRKCRLNCRTRASIDIWKSRFSPHRGHSAYITEQATPLYQWISRAYTQTVGSEYLGNTVPQGHVDRRGLRNESLLGLTFPDSSFDFILSFDVLEHIPDYPRALRECLRTLRPGGVVLFTVPFLRNSEKTVVRARVDTGGQIEHILPPEYHGDPINSDGCLCFYHFGWDLLDALREVGFTECFAHLLWSEYFAYLGEEQIVFSGHRPLR